MTNTYIHAFAGASSGSGITDLTGDVTATGPGSAAATIANNAVTLAKFQTISSNTLVGNPTGSSSNASLITLGSGLAFSGTTLISTGGGSGTVTSVALTAPAIFNVSGSPITSSGTLAITLATESANLVWAGPTTGSAATPTFRSLVAADIPSLSGTYVTQSEVGAISGVASLDSGGHIPLSQLPATLVEYQGTWNASTNTPTLANGTGISGLFYIVSTGGTVNFGAGNITFNAGDWVLYNGTVWEQAVQSNTVQSVNSLTGVVTINAINQLTSDVTTSAASQSQSLASTVAAIQGKTVSGTTGTGNVVFSASPTVTGTLSAAAISASGTIGGSNLSGTNTGDQTITLTGNVTGSGTGSFVTTIAANIVANSQLAQMATHTIKGNNTAGTANAADLTAAQVNAILPIFTSTLNGLAPLSGGGSTNYLRADGTWAAPPGSTSGTVTSVALTAPGIFSVSGSPITSAGTLALALATQSANTIWAGPSSGGAVAPAFRSLVTADFPANGVTYAKLQTVAANNLIGNPTGSTATAAGITLATSLAFNSSALKVNLSSTSLADTGSGLFVNLDPSGPLLVDGGSGLIVTIGDASISTVSAISVVVDPSSALITASGSGVNLVVDSDSTNSGASSTTIVTKNGTNNYLEAHGLNSEQLTLNTTNITNQYVDLSFPITDVNSVSLFLMYGTIFSRGTDYIVSATGGSGGVGRITFAGRLGTGGISVLIPGSVIVVQYMRFQ